MIVRHRGWAVAVLVATLGLGCHAAKDDPEGQASELADPVRRENAIYNLKEIYTETLAANNGDRSSEAVAEVAADTAGALVTTLGGTVDAKAISSAVSDRLKG